MIYNISNKNAFRLPFKNQFWYLEIYIHTKINHWNDTDFWEVQVIKDFPDFTPDALIQIPNKLWLRNFPHTKSFLLSKNWITIYSRYIAVQYNQMLSTKRQGEN